MLHQWNEFGEVSQNEDRSPAWPEGFVGSISHSNNWVWSAASKTEHIQSIGIDTEPVASQQTRLEIQTEIASQPEWDLINSLELEREVEFTVLFSAKEALYKCLYPVAQEYFGFDQAIVCDCQEGKLTLQLTETNPNQKHSPEKLDVYFLVESDNIFAVTWLTNRV